LEEEFSQRTFKDLVTRCRIKKRQTEVIVKIAICRERRPDVVCDVFEEYPGHRDT